MVMTFVAAIVAVASIATACFGGLASPETAANTVVAAVIASAAALAG